MVGPEAAQEICGRIVFWGSPPSRVEAEAWAQAGQESRLGALLQLREVCHFLCHSFFTDWNGTVLELVEYLNICCGVYLVRDVAVYVELGKR